MDSLNIKINTHSSIRIEEGEKIFYFDPFELEGKFNDADYIFITHNHYDHLDSKSIQNAMNDKTKFICPKSLVKELSANVGIKDLAKVVQLLPGEKIELENDIKLEAIPAYNIGKHFHQKDSGWLGYILDVNGKRFYIAGDTDLTDEAKSVKCDVALIPIGGTYTMDYEQAAELINIIRPKLAIPTHYGTIVGEYDLGKKFLSLVDKDIVGKEIVTK